MPNPIRLPDGSIKNITIKLVGKPWRCSCGCNVFHHPDETKPDVYECNSCQTQYDSE